jgi:hypothetical protein
MKAAPFVLTAFACLAAVQGASACDHDTSINAFNMSCSAPVRWADRHDASDTRFAITTDNRKAMLLITDRVVAIQLSDHVLHKIDRKLKQAEYEDADNTVGRVIKTTVLSTVREVLNHSAEVDIRDIRSVDYRDGELVLKARNGHRIFARADIDNDNVMSEFSDSDARAFVNELRQRMAVAR